MPKANTVSEILRFGMSTLFSASLSAGLPILLHEVLSVNEERAVAIGFATAYLANILLLKLFVFRSSGRWIHELIKYVPTNGLFRLLEYTVFLALVRVVDLDYRIAVFSVLSITLGLKFLVYRLIFRRKLTSGGAVSEL